MKYLRESSCDGKHRHATMAKARAHARLFRKRSGDNLRPYHCCFCGGFHLGHSRGAKRHNRWK